MNVCTYIHLCADRRYFFSVLNTGNSAFHTRARLGGGEGINQEIEYVLTGKVKGIASVFPPQGYFASLATTNTQVHILCVG